MFQKCDRKNTGGGEFYLRDTIVLYCFYCKALEFIFLDPPPSIGWIFGEFFETKISEITSSTTLLQIIV